MGSRGGTQSKSSTMGEGEKVLAAKGARPKAGPGL